MYNGGSRYEQVVKLMKKVYITFRNLAGYIGVLPHQIP